MTDSVDALSIPTRKLITIKDAAAYASVTPRTIRSWIAQGGLPCYRSEHNTRTVRVDLAELERPSSCAARAAGCQRPAEGHAAARSR